MTGSSFAVAASKVGTAVVSFCGAVYFAFSPTDQDWGHASTLFVAGCGILGWTFEGVKSATERETIQAKLDTIVPSEVKDHPHVD